jgi:hypothetical protein
MGVTQSKRTDRLPHPEADGRVERLGDLKVQAPESICAALF